MMNIPESFRAGDTCQWIDQPITINGTTYGSSVYTLSYIIAGPVAPITLVAAPSGDGWQTTISLSDAENFTAGSYAWQAVLTSAAVRITVASGRLAVEANLADAIAGYDPRSIAEKALAEAEAALAQYHATGGKVKEYVIGQRSMKFADSTQILQEISYWRTEVAKERNKARIAAGLGGGNTLGVMFR